MKVRKNKKMPRRSKKKKSVALGSGIAGALIVTALFAVTQKNTPDVSEEMISRTEEEGTGSSEPSATEGMASSIRASGYTTSELFVFADAEPFSDLDTPPEVTAVAPPPEPYRLCDDQFSSSFTIGGNYTHVNFKPSGNSSFHGNLGGAQGAYEYKSKGGFYAGITGSWKQGHMHGSAGKRSLLYIDTQERLGYTVTTKECEFSCTFFSGLGYRHYGQKLVPTTGDTLKFRYNDLYVPVGFESDYSVYSWFSVGLDATWMAQVYPTVSITPLKGSRWVLTKTFSNFSVKVPINFALTENRRFHLSFNPFYERWKDGHSTAKTSTGVSLGLPSNTYNFWGGEVNFIYCF